MTEEAHVQSAAVPLGLLLWGTNTEAQARPSFQALRGERTRTGSTSLPLSLPDPTPTCSPRHTSHHNVKVMDYCWAPCLGSSPVLLRETRSKSPLYPSVPEMLLTQTLLLLEPSVWQTEDQPEEPASQLTWWGGSRKRREVEVQNGASGPTSWKEQWPSRTRFSPVPIISPALWAPS